MGLNLPLTLARRRYPFPHSLRSRGAGLASGIWFLTSGILVLAQDTQGEPCSVAVFDRELALDLGQQIPDQPEPK